jgi:hypothetical protein
MQGAFGLVLCLLIGLAVSQVQGLAHGEAVALAEVTTTVALHPAVDWLPGVAGRDDDPGRTVPYLEEAPMR